MLSDTPFAAPIVLSIIGLLQERQRRTRPSSARIGQGIAYTTGTLLATG